MKSFTLDEVPNKHLHSRYLDYILNAMCGFNFSGFSSGSLPTRKHGMEHPASTHCPLEDEQSRLLKRKNAKGHSVAVVLAI